MASDENKQLYDFSIRLALYVEAIKATQTIKLDNILRDSSEVLSRALWRLRHDKVGDLSKVELNRLLINLRKSQRQIYATYANTLLGSLDEFMQADLSVNRRLWVESLLIAGELSGKSIVSDIEAIEYIKDNFKSSLLGVAAITSDDTTRLRSIVMNKPISANGMTIGPFVDNFTLVAQAAVENTIRKAWANQSTVKELNQELLGETAQGTKSVMSRIHNQSRAVVHTAIAEVHSTITTGVSSALFGRYMWNSVIDAVTTEICRSRNRVIYEYGKGPMPPAHINCRSTITPIGSGDPYQVDETLVAWTIKQPTRVRNDVSMDKPMTFERFQNSVNVMLWR